jgi:hypothetical protein
LTDQDYQELSDLGVDATSLATALQVESVDTTDTEYVPESELDAPPLTDEMMSLSDNQIRDLLAEIQATRFM